MYREQQWFEAFEFSYDMSVPNVAHLEPQRGGCCTVMPYFVGNLLELPLTTTQDYSLFHILGSYSTALWRQQIELIMARNGLVSFIAHPDYLCDDRAKGVYRRVTDSPDLPACGKKPLGCVAWRGQRLVAKPPPDVARAGGPFVADRRTGLPSRPVGIRDT